MPAAYPPVAINALGDCSAAIRVIRRQLPVEAATVRQLRQGWDR